MSKRNMHFTVSVAALVLGAAFASAPAFAQGRTPAPTYGRAANDGGMLGVTVNGQQAGPGSDANYAPQRNGRTNAPAPHPARAPNDGGPVQ